MTRALLGEALNEMELRLGRVESTRVQQSSAPSVQAYTNPDTGAAVIAESLQWQTGWAHYSTPTASMVSSADPEQPPDPTLTWSRVYGPAEAILMGGQCFLTGIVKRTGATLAASTRYDSPMFGLPIGWRPQFNVILPCLCGTSVPAEGPGAFAVQTAWVEVKPDITLDYGRVYFTGANAALNVNVGWIALAGAFPCRVTGWTDGT